MLNKGINEFNKKNYFKLRFRNEAKYIIKIKRSLGNRGILMKGEGVIQVD